MHNRIDDQFPDLSGTECTTEETSNSLVYQEQNTQQNRRAIPSSIKNRMHNRIDDQFYACSAEHLDYWIIMPFCVFVFMIHNTLSHVDVNIKVCELKASHIIKEFLLIKRMFLFWSNSTAVFYDVMRKLSTFLCANQYIKRRQNCLCLLPHARHHQQAKNCRVSTAQPQFISRRLHMKTNDKKLKITNVNKTEILQLNSSVEMLKTNRQDLGRSRDCWSCPQWHHQEDLSYDRLYALLHSINTQVHMITFTSAACRNVSV